MKPPALLATLALAAVALAGGSLAPLPPVRGLCIAAPNASEVDAFARFLNAPQKLKAGQPLRLRYRLITHDGPAPVELLKKLADEFRVGER